MPPQRNTVVFTGVFDKRMDPQLKQLVEDPVRASLARRTIRGLYEGGWNPVVVYSPDCTDETKRVIREYANNGGDVEAGNGMGSLVRQGLRRSLELKAGCYVWMEAEKSPFVEHIEPLARVVEADEADHVIPGRMECFDAPVLRSYPKFQAHTEMAGNAYVNRAYHGRWLDLSNPKDEQDYLDLFFGPDVFNEKAAKHFFAYGDLQFPEKPDQWDAHMFPVFLAQRAGLRVGSVRVPYKHPGEQTRSEESVDEGAWVGKRIKQLSQLQRATDEFMKRLAQKGY